MASNEELFMYAEKMKKYVDVLKEVKLNIDAYNDDFVIEEMKTYNSSDFIVRRKIRLAFEPLYNFLKNVDDKTIRQFILVFGLFSYTLDWDDFKVFGKNNGSLSLFLSDENNSEFNFSNLYKIKRDDDNILKDFNTNFLKFIRNGISHGKFDIDFDLEKIILKMWGGKIEIEIDGSGVVNLPLNLPRLYNQISGLSCPILFNEIEPPYKTAFKLSIVNGKSDSKLLTSNKIPKDIKEYARKLKDYIESVEHAGYKLSAGDKIGMINSNFVFKNKGKNESIDVYKAILNYIGVEIKNINIIDFDKDIYCNNKFIKFACESATEGNNTNRLNIAEAIECKVPVYMAGFDRFGSLATLTSSLYGNLSVKDFVDKILDDFSYIYMDDICEYADRAYVNYVCNYLVEKFKISDKWKSVGISKYFTIKSSNKNYSVYDVFQASENTAFIRNCLVHSEYFKFQNGVYHFKDCDKSGNVVFDAEISRDKLLMFEDELLEDFKCTYLKESQENTKI
ncbi:MAG: hypothetical protein J5689_01910 [Clostridia bacterium]|nr:hypothetical protein [Clostridia bacterium]